MSKFKNNKVYLVRCKKSTNFCGFYPDYKEGEYYRCIKKDFGGKILWHTIDLESKNTELDFSWDWKSWLLHMDIPFKPLVTYKLKEGDILKCIENFTTDRTSWTKGKEYKVKISENGYVMLRNNFSVLRHSYIDNDILNYFIKPKTLLEELIETWKPLSLILENNTKIKIKDRTDIPKAPETPWEDKLKGEDALFVKFMREEGAWGRYKECFEKYGNLSFKTTEEYFSSPYCGYFFPFPARYLGNDDINRRKFTEWKKQYTPSWHFRDDNIDWDQITNDMLRDNIPAFYVEGDGKAYVGFIWCKESMDMSHKDWFITMPEYDQFPVSLMNYPYDIAEVKPWDKDIWQKICKEFSKRYKSWGKDLDQKIKDRTRVKEDPSRFEVYTY